jgi:hypothetical protein
MAESITALLVSPRTALRWLDPHCDLHVRLYGLIKTRRP